MIECRCAIHARTLTILAAAVLAVTGCQAPTPTPEAVAAVPPTTVATALPPAVATVLPVRTPTPTDQPRLAGPRTEFEGVSISVPKDLAADVVASWVPATPEGDHPVSGRVRFVLQGYPVTGRTEPAMVEVFHGPMTDDAPPNFMDRYRPLFAMLEEQPKEPGFVEMLPETKRQLFQARVSYRPFYDQPGRGVRTLTQFGNAPRPINNGELMYMFQGLAPAQAAWVAIMAPITVDDPSVAAGPDAATPEGFAAGFTLYMTRTVRHLNELPPEAFTPNLRLLDELAASVDVTWPVPTQFAQPPPGTPPATVTPPVMTPASAATTNP